MNNHQDKKRPYLEQYETVFSLPPRLDLTSSQERELKEIESTCDELNSYVHNTAAPAAATLRELNELSIWNEMYASLGVASSESGFIQEELLETKQIKSRELLLKREAYYVLYMVKLKRILLKLEKKPAFTYDLVNGNHYPQSDKMRSIEKLISIMNETLLSLEKTAFSLVQPQLIDEPLSLENLALSLIQLQHIQDALKHLHENWIIQRDTNRETLQHAVNTEGQPLRFRPPFSCSGQSIFNNISRNKNVLPTSQSLEIREKRCIAQIVALEDQLFSLRNDLKNTSNNNEWQGYFDSLLTISPSQF